MTTWCVGGTDYYLVREESCAEQDVPHIVFFYSVLEKNPHKNPCLIHYNVPPLPTPTFFSVIHHSELVDTTWSFTVFLVTCTKMCEV